MWIGYWDTRGKLLNAFNLVGFYGADSCMHACMHIIHSFISFILLIHSFISFISFMHSFIHLSIH